MSLNLKTYIDGHCVSTVLLSIEHSWDGEDGGYFYETYIFASSDGKTITNWLEEWGTRYKTETEAREGHAHVCAAVEAGALP